MTLRVDSELPRASELIGWEARPSLQLLCWIGVSVCMLPVVCDALQVKLPLHFGQLDPWLAERATREWSGIATGTLLLSQFVFGVLRRLMLRSREAFHRWRTAHELVPLALLGASLLHTRGHVGNNLNRWLVSILLLQIALVQAGHVTKAIASRYAAHRLFAVLDRASNSHTGFVHRAGVTIHVLLASCVLVLFACHVLSIWYF